MCASQQPKTYMEIQKVGITLLCKYGINNSILQLYGTKKESSRHWG